MDIFRQHEIFEIEVLDHMKSARLLEPLVFGGGTMLRLCHDLARYSVDLNFWFLKIISQDLFFDKLCNALGKTYEVTDAQIKHYTLLIELRNRAYPKRLKIEIRKAVEMCDFQETIAYSKYTNKQVALRAHTLNQSMKNKIKAFQDREEIRDCFDIEFLLRRGVELPADIAGAPERILQIIDGFKDSDYKVKLGSILEADFREYYVTQKFNFLKEHLSSVLSKT